MSEQKYKDIIYRIENGIAVLTINRPEKLNSMTTGTIWELREAVLEADSDKETKIIVLTGSGKQAFCSGFDIINVPHLEIAESRQLHIRNSALSKALMEIGKPIIAAVNGMALGLVLKLVCFATLPLQVNRQHSLCPN